MTAPATKYHTCPVCDEGCKCCDGDLYIEDCECCDDIEEDSEEEIVGRDGMGNAAVYLARADTTPKMMREIAYNLGVQKRREGRYWTVAWRDVRQGAIMKLCHTRITIEEAQRLFTAGFNEMDAEYKEMTS